MSASSQSVGSDNDEAESEDNDEFTYYPQVTQHPTSVIEGDIVEIVTGSDIDGGAEQTGSSFGIVFEDPSVVGDGTIWQNRNVPDGFETTSEYNDTIRMAQADDDINYVRGREVTDEAIEDAQARLDEADVDYEDEDYDTLKVSGTDYKVADPNDRDASVQEVSGQTLGIDVGGGVYESEQADAFDTSRIMVWYGGMSGQFVGRGLDFNGMPFTRYTDDGYLVKGLFQVAIGWRGDADVEEYDNVPTTDRSELATDLGRKPRVARPPVLRDDIDGRAFIGIGRYNGGNMHEVHIGRGEESYDDIITSMRDNEEPDYDSLDMKYNQEPEERLASAFEDTSDIYALYHGEGWQSEPDNAQSVLGDEGADTDGGSFDVPDGDTDDNTIDHPTAEETTFAKTVAEKLAGTDVTPDEAFDSKGGLEGLVEANSGNFDQEYTIEAIRAEVYANTEHLSDDDL